MLQDISIIQTQLTDAVAKVKQTNKRTLFSTVIKINRLSPLSFFAFGEEHYKGTRFYWSEPNENLTISCLGYACTFFYPYKSQDSGFIEQEWKQLCKGAIVCGEQVECTGPVLVGGQVFDPLKPKTDLWKHYADFHYYIPMFVLTKKNEDCFLTINIILDPSRMEDEIARIIATIHRLQEWKDHHIAEYRAIVTQKMELYVPQWMSAVHQAVSAIKSELFHKVVLAREMRVRLQHPDLPGILQYLSTYAPNSYVFALESQKDCFIGASPERLIQKRGTILYSTCLAGSIPRKKDMPDDAAAQHLLMDGKNRKEHQYVVDMIRSVLEPVCNHLEVPDTPMIMKLAHLFHLYTPIQGIVDPHISLMQLVSHLHPTPALGGLPKTEALSFIREHEPLDRGLYGAPLGWLDAQGNGEFIVAIRSALLQEDEASIFAGCGIVADSIPEMELEETKVKMKPMLTALGGMFHE